MTPAGVRSESEFGRLSVKGECDMRQSSVRPVVPVLLLLAAFVLTSGCGGCGGGGGGGGVKYIPVPSRRPVPKGRVDPNVASDPTYDLSGTWTVVSTNSLNSCGELPEDFEFELTLVHNVATGEVEGSYEGIDVTGTFEKGVLEVDLPYRYREDDEDDGAEAWTTMTQVTVYIVAPDELSGVSTWEWDRVADDRWDCEGLDYWAGVRSD